MPCVWLVRGGMALLLCAWASVDGTFHITSYGINEGGIKMAKCLRCGAGNEWIEGDSRKAPLSFNASVSRWKKLADVKPEKKLKALFMRDGEIFQGWWSVRHECFYTREKVVIEKVELWMPIFSFG